LNAKSALKGAEATAQSWIQAQQEAGAVVVGAVVAAHEAIGARRAADEWPKA